MNTQYPIEGIEGADKSKESTLSNAPMLVAPGFAAVVAKSTKNSDSDHGMHWDNSGKNGFYLICMLFMIRFLFQYYNVDFFPPHFLFLNAGRPDYLTFNSF